jgi:hypothetical protein
VGAIADSHWNGNAKTLYLLQEIVFFCLRLCTSTIGNFVSFSRKVCTSSVINKRIYLFHWKGQNVEMTSSLFLAAMFFLTLLPGLYPRGMQFWQ